jgi:hypothetical protein
VSLSKFPVIAPDGTEYRVSITEWDSRFEDYAEVTIYRERRKRGPFRFRKLFTTEIRKHGGYDVSDPDYIALAWIGIGRYLAHVSEVNARERREAETEIRRSAAAEAFTKWDGRIVEEANV